MLNPPRARARGGDATIRRDRRTILGTVIVADIATASEAQRIVADVIARYGRLDVLINNAGVITVGPLEHIPWATSRSRCRYISGVRSTPCAAIPHMRQAGGGRIVDISSIGGKVGVPHLAPYCTGKFALTGVLTAARAELSRDGILVTTVSPGLVLTANPRSIRARRRIRWDPFWLAANTSLDRNTVCGVAAVDAMRCPSSGVPQFVFDGDERGHPITALSEGSGAPCTAFFERPRGRSVAPFTRRLRDTPTNRRQARSCRTQRLISGVVTRRYAAPFTHGPERPPITFVGARDVGQFLVIPRMSAFRTRKIEKIIVFRRTHIAGAIVRVKKIGRTQWPDHHARKEPHERREGAGRVEPNRRLLPAACAQAVRTGCARLPA